MTGEIFYLSTVRGIASQDREEEPKYLFCGLVSRIPRAKFDRIADGEKSSVDEAAAMLERLGKPFIGWDGKTYAPALDQPTERYEVRDIETGDLLVMWRLACQPVKEHKA